MEGDGGCSPLPWPVYQGSSTRSESPSTLTNAFVNSAATVDLSDEFFSDLLIPHALVSALRPLSSLRLQHTIVTLFVFGRSTREVDARRIA